MILAWLVVLAVVGIGVTEYTGMTLHRFGFETITDASRQNPHIFWLVFLAFLVALSWWPLHIYGEAWSHRFLPTWLQWFI